MRKELLGPLPLALGAVAIVIAVMTPMGPPAAHCDCEVLNPAQFAQLDASGYAGVAPNSTMVVDGRVVSVQPHTLVDAPSHRIRLEGSDIEFNVTVFDDAVPFEGAWVRLTTVHQGQSEAGGPDTGHRWRFLGQTTWGGAPYVSLTAYSAGFAGVVWGLATFGAFGRARDRERSLKARVRGAQEAARGDPAISRHGPSTGALAAARRQVRRGQYDSAGETLGLFEARQARVKAVREMAADIGKTVDQMVGDASEGGTGPARALLQEAGSQLEGADIEEADATLERAMAFVRAGGRTTDLVGRALRLTAAASAAGVDMDGPDEAVERAVSLLRGGKWPEAEEAAKDALEKAVDASPDARSARDAIQRLEDAIDTDRTGELPREVAHQHAAARSAYASGEFARAVALADSARWAADPSAMDEEGLRTLLAGLWGARGWRAELGAARPPAGGLLFAKGEERVLILTSGWREFPTERQLLAAKDFIREGHATRARVYSSAFTNTSTDPLVVVVTVRSLLEDLLEAAEAAAALKGS